MKFNLIYIVKYFINKTIIEKVGIEWNKKTEAESGRN